MLYALLTAVLILSAIQAIRAKRLITSALWLAGTSALLSVVFYLMGASQVAVIELSVGAGLVTVLFVFAISVAGDEGLDEPSILPKPLAWVLVILSVVLVGRFTIPQFGNSSQVTELPITAVFWELRGLDVLIQMVLIFAGVLGLLGLLAEAKAPLDQPMVDEIAAIRERDLRAMELQEQIVLEREEA